VKIRPVGPKLFLAGGRKDRRTDGGKDRWTDGRTSIDMTKLQVVFLKLAKAPYESTSYT